MSRQRREQAPLNQRHPERISGTGERRRTSRDLPCTRVFQSVCWKARFSVETGLLPCATWLLVAPMFGARTEESLVAMETRARRDAEMEGDVCCLQRWTNIFVGKHKKWPRLFFFFFLVTS